ncbi:hypothetical protein [Yoonia sp. I 8.24]|nr:hypothetical protein [Yoonia sp. I 8.24]MCG3267134.1 hypothetical protein [Yoonia sp. I 8.24]
MDLIIETCDPIRHDRIDHLIAMDDLNPANAADIRVHEIKLTQPIL